MVNHKVVDHTKGQILDLPLQITDNSKTVIGQEQNLKVLDQGTTEQRKPRLKYWMLES